MFKDREDAGERLSEKLIEYKNKNDVVVLAIPRGGIILGYKIAQNINVPMDIVVVRKIGAPDNPEFAVGAIDEKGGIIENPEVELSQEFLNKEVKKEKEEIKRRIKEYRGEKEELDIKNKIVLLVDDGIATGLTVIKAIDFIKSKNAKKIILAVPVIADDVLNTIEKIVDKVVYLESPVIFFAVGQFYYNFPQVSDEEVKKIMSKV